MALCFDEGAHHAITRGYPKHMNDVTASSEDRNLAMLTHLSGILLGFIVPLIIWLTNKDKTDKAWLNTQAVEALNFQITIAIAYVAGSVLMAVLIGFPDHPGCNFWSTSFFASSPAWPAIKVKAIATRSHCG